MKRKLILIVCFSLMLVLMPLVAFTGCQQNSNQMFEFGLMIGDTYSVKSIKNKDITSIEIPSTYNGKQVKYIGRSAFEDCDKLISVVIPEGIEEIDSYAFKGCADLKNISLPNSIKEIDYSAFEGCNSLEYNIYENGRYLGNNENSCVVLMSGIDKEVSTFKVNENCNVVYNKALSGFLKLKTIDMPYSITYIGSDAFTLCSSLESFVVPNFVKHFDASWFSYCSSLKSITLSANTETVSVGYMHGCDSFSEFKVYSTNSKFAAKDGVLYSKDLKTLLVYPIAKEGSDFDIPSYVETIAMYAFDGCVNLKSLTMWATIKTLRSGAVINCDLLHTINFNGTTNEWIALDNANLGWDHSFSVNKVNCSNGTLNRSKA